MRTVGWIASAVLIAAGPTGPPPTSVAACWAEFRSLEHQVGESPLIFVGLVAAVESVPERMNKDLPLPETKPTVATVRVVRTLRGTWDRPTIRVYSGPVRSCNPTPQHYRFEVGTSHVYLAPEAPREGAFPLTWGGSRLPLTHLEAVEARILRARCFRDDYLDRVKRESPETHAAASLLHEQLLRESPSWPEWGNENLSEHVEKFRKRLKTMSAETFRTACAFDWPGPAWSRRDVVTYSFAWVPNGMEEYVATAERHRLRKELERLGAEAPLIDRYFASVKQTDFRLSFPPEPPTPSRTPKEVLTLQFLLEFHSYDREGNLACHFMELDHMEHLDPRRVDLEVRALYGSDSDTMRTFARRCIERIPGASFIDLVLESQLDRDEAWRDLEHPEDPLQTSARLKGLVALASKLRTTWGRQHFWLSLGRGRCFDPVVIEAALAALDAPEQVKEVSEGIHGYLRAAMDSRREPPPASNLDSAGYRAWFRDHSPKEPK